MRTLPLGNGTSRISEIALGTWPFAGDEIWGPSEEATCIRVVHAALDSGITLFDTAPNYGDGRSESVLGKALRGHPEALVAGKFKIHGRSAADLRSLLTGSLRRLGRDHIDLMQIHWPGDTPDETAAALDALGRFRTEGLVGQIGVCNFGRFDLEETDGCPLVTNQVPYNLLWRVIEDEVVPATAARDLRTIAYSPFQQGLLTGRYRTLEEFPAGRQRTRHFLATPVTVGDSVTTMRAETAKALDSLTATAEHLGRPLRELALAFVRSRPFVDVVLVGARTEKQLEEICAARQPLEDGEVAMLENATERLRLTAGRNPDMYREPGRVRHTTPGRTL